MAKAEDYIYLRKGDIIEYGDEIMLYNCDWVVSGMSLVLGLPYDPIYMLPHRRLPKFTIEDLYKSNDTNDPDDFILGMIYE